MTAGERRLDSFPVEASAKRAPRALEGDKAQRIVSAMRSSIGRRGAAGSTFDNVAHEAGVSRGLLHYYFGSKERLLVEVVRHDCKIRQQLLSEALAGADSVEAIVDVLVRSLQDALDHDPGFFALLFEMWTASRHQDEVREEMAQLYTEVRAQVGGLLRDKEREGVVSLRGEPEAVAAVLFALGDGMALQVLSDPAADHSAAFEAGIVAAKALLGE